MRTSHVHRILPLSVAAAVLALALLCPQAGARQEPQDEPSGWIPLEDEELARLRGGFSVENGPRIDFSIERSLYMGEELSGRLVLSVTDLRQAARDPGNIRLERWGSEELAAAPLEALVAGEGGLSAASLNIVRNSRDQEQIRTLTQIDLTLVNWGAALSRADASARLRNLFSPLR